MLFHLFLIEPIPNPCTFIALIAKQCKKALSFLLKRTIVNPEQ